MRWILRTLPLYPVKYVVHLALPLTLQKGEGLRAAAAIRKCTNLRLLRIEPTFIRTTPLDAVLEAFGTLDLEEMDMFGPPTMLLPILSTQTQLTRLRLSPGLSDDSHFKKLDEVIRILPTTLRHLHLPLYTPEHLTWFVEQHGLNLSELTIEMELTPPAMQMADFFVNLKPLHPLLESLHILGPALRYSDFIKLGELICEWPTLRTVCIPKGKGWWPQWVKILRESNVTHINHTKNIPVLCQLRNNQIRHSTLVELASPTVPLELHWPYHTPCTIPLYPLSGAEQ